MKLLILFVIIFTSSFTCAQTNQTVLYIGASHSYGAFGQVMDIKKQFADFGKKMERLKLDSKLIKRLSYPSGTRVGRKG